MNFKKGGTEQVFYSLEEEKEHDKRTKELNDAKKASNEAENDGRTLFERLEEQRQAKRQEIEDKLKYKNQIYQGLDEDEYEFIRDVDQRAEELENRKWEEEIQEVKSYRILAEYTEFANLVKQNPDLVQTEKQESSIASTTKDNSNVSAATSSTTSGWQTQPSVTGMLSGATKKTALSQLIRVKKPTTSDSDKDKDKDQNKQKNNDKSDTGVKATTDTKNNTTKLNEKRPLEQENSTDINDTSRKQPKIEAESSKSLSSTPPVVSLSALAAYGSDSDSE